MNKKRLTRSKNNKILGGVCAGIANYFGWDAPKTRLGYVLLSLVSAAFPGGIIYVVLWVVMPEE